MNLQEAIANAIINTKVFDTKADDKDSGTFKVVITSEVVDRDGEIIRLGGWDFENFMKNPVVLRGHRYYDLPVAKATGLSVKDGQVISTGVFAPADANPMGQQIRKLYEWWFINAVSVWFKVIKRNPDNRYIIEEAELLEYSFVTVPANPEALGMGKGVKSYMETAIWDATKDANTIYYATYLIGNDSAKGNGDAPEVAKWLDTIIEMINQMGSKIDGVIDDVKNIKNTADGKAKSKEHISKETLQEVNRLSAEALRDLKLN